MLVMKLVMILIVIMDIKLVFYLVKVLFGIVE